MSDDTNIDKLAETYLDLWQENIRLWSVDKELLPLPELLRLVRLGEETEAPDG